MKRTLLLAVFLTALSALPAAAQELKISDNGTLLNISATAKVSTKPDLAEMTAGVEAKSRSAQTAYTEASQKMTKMFEMLKAAGIEEKNITTSGLILNSYRDIDYSNGAEKVTFNGYKAENNISVKIRDLENIGKVIDALVSQGSNQLQGPFFSVEKQDDFLNQARTEAIKKAQAQADLYAANSGLVIKRIVSISENPIYPQPIFHRPMMMMKAAMMEGAGMADASTPVAAGEQDVGVTVNMQYELEKK